MGLINLYYQGDFLFLLKGIDLSYIILVRLVSVVCCFLSMKIDPFEQYRFEFRFS